MRDSSGGRMMEPADALQALLRTGVRRDGGHRGGQGDGYPGRPDDGPSGEVNEWGDVVRIARLSGGSINQVYRAELSTGKSVVFKWHDDPPDGFFEAERQGLQALRDAEALRVPVMYAVAHNGIAMEWLAPEDTAGGGRDPGTALGTGLARQHRVTADSYGFDADNFIGLLSQANRRTTEWIPFYRACRLQPQLELAESSGHMNRRRERWADRLLKRLPEWIDEARVSPSLLHGDLWGGNWLRTGSGPAILDPAVSYGDREMDLAMAELFGGFPPSFFRAYREAYPLAPGYEARRPLYQLYYLLIHLNLFGEAYGSQVDRVLRRYGG